MRLSQRNRVLGGALLSVFVATAILGAIWTPYDPLGIDLTKRLEAPGILHWLGTDEFGRDVLSRIMAAAGTSVSISVMTVCFAVAAGVLLGVVSGYARGWLDRAIMTLNDSLLAFPSMLLALALLSITGANMYGIILALGLAYTPSMVRIVRGAVLSLREQEFVQASRVMGNSAIFTMIRHILPNCLAPVIVLATSMFGTVLLTESALSFLGLGVPPPAPTWGNMLASARPHMAQAVWLGIFPGLCISLTLLGINLFGDAIRDRFDPRMRGL
ncbi:ABC transporter permease [Pelagibacterium halotolerans]|uniref:Dipeptide transport system permease protein DppC n=1 Tax=Pelagibacterium halotolerans (strain DSM 22347 / JCM 15775 / CGMCC 1.7692 / B2) TaxID=1082931 RepID=G4RD59_PELHB|nr:ABC transporter permease [Pelagibacterium halotolerans]AEQ53809.1 dipeptide transport system permease protein DppC [Pelagibacterium halotolerans B2]QJR20036.1 ABC transporter permease [Pelagibacterium halotolerans]SEA81435.1 peptide/nickel transport system permease protein [Pelagibacterium halotolerans]